jgi:hypothetical protein
MRPSLSSFLNRQQRRSVSFCSPISLFSLSSLKAPSSSSLSVVTNCGGGGDKKSQSQTRSLTSSYPSHKIRSTLKNGASYSNAANITLYSSLSPLSSFVLSKQAQGQSNSQLQQRSMATTSSSHDETSKFGKVCLLFSSLSLFLN